MEIPVKVKPKMIDAHVSQKRKMPSYSLNENGVPVAKVKWYFLVKFPNGGSQWMPEEYLEFTEQDRKQIKWLHYWKGK